MKKVQRQKLKPCWQTAMVLSSLHSGCEIRAPSVPRRHGRELPAVATGTSHISNTGAIYKKEQYAYGHLLRWIILQTSGGQLRFAIGRSAQAPRQPVLIYWCSTVYEQVSGDARCGCVSRPTDHHALISARVCTYPRRLSAVAAATRTFLPGSSCSKPLKQPFSCALKRCRSCRRTAAPNLMTKPDGSM